MVQIHLLFWGCLESHLHCLIVGSGWLKIQFLHHHTPPMSSDIGDDIQFATSPRLVDWDLHTWIAVIIHIEAKNLHPNKQWSSTKIAQTLLDVHPGSVKLREQTILWLVDPWAESILGNSSSASIPLDHRHGQLFRDLWTDDGTLSRSKYMYICIYVYMYICIYVYIYMYICIYVYM